MTRNNNSLESALNEAKNFANAAANDFYGSGFMLTLCGNSGTGKTMLAKLVMKSLGWNAWHTFDRIPPLNTGRHIERAGGKFYDWRRVSDKMKKGEWDIVEAIEEQAFVVLDDIGAEYDPSGVAASKLDRILRSRQHKWTIVTCNLSLAQIAQKLDTRIASFLARDRNVVCQIDAEDFAFENL